MKRVVVVGAGVAGLASAYEILRSAKLAGLDDLSITVLEASAQAGGNIRTDHAEGYTVELGSNGFLDNVPETLELIENIGYSDRIQPSSDSAARRFIFRDGRLHEVPTSPPAFLTSSILSRPGKLRVLFEPFARKAKRDDESVYDFAARRIGREAADVLVSAMVIGIYGGDARRLELASTFPKMREMEIEHGGLFRAMLAKKKVTAESDAPAGPGGPGGRLTSFVGGFETLIKGLCDALGSAQFLTDTRVTQVLIDGPIFRVATEDGRPFEAEAVVLATPAWDAAGAVRLMDGEMADALDEIQGAPITVVATGYDNESLDADTHGFGFLVPRGHGVRILGCLWTSSVFEGRAPQGKTLLRSMVGGAVDPEAMQMDDDGLVELVSRDLETTMSLSARPSFVRVYRHRRGIPQYLQGHAERLGLIHRRLADVPGLVLTGNSYEGIAVNSCIKDSLRVASQVLSHISDEQ